jgi:hypothetical protein
MADGTEIEHVQIDGPTDDVATCVKMLGLAHLVITANVMARFGFVKAGSPIHRPKSGPG